MNCVQLVDRSFNVLLTNSNTMKERSSTSSTARVFASRMSPVTHAERSSHKHAVGVLLLLLAIDAVMIVLAVMQNRGVLTDPRFLLWWERGFPEMLQYAKYAAGAIIMFRGAARGYGRTAVVWGMLFMLLLCEDSLMIHERIGARIGTYLHFPSIRSMEPAQLGEIVVAAGEGGTFFIALVLTLRTASHASRRLTFALLVGLFALAGFGVIVDAINSMASRGTWIRRVLGFVEDGGEMVAASLLVWTAWVWRDPERG
jgi:hypothetical protein